MAAGAPKRTKVIERGLYVLATAGTQGVPKDVAAAAGFPSTLNRRERYALKAAAKWARGGFEGKRSNAVMAGFVVMAHAVFNSPARVIANLMGKGGLTPKERYGIKAAADWIFEMQIYDVLTDDSGCDDDG